MIRMADNRGRDSHNMWAEMPPSRKNRPTQPEKPAEEAEDIRHSSKEKRKKHSDKKKKEAKKQEKKQKTKKSVNAEIKKEEKKSRGKSVSHKEDYGTPSYLEDDGTIAKPIDIQSRVLKNKSKDRKSKEEVTEKKSLKKRLTGHFSRNLLFYAIGIIVVVVISVVLSRTVLFNLSKIEIVGETVYSNEEIIDKCGVELGTNLNFINEGEITDRLIDALPFVDKVTVRKNYFKSHLIITLNQATPLANIQTRDGGYYLISENGRILDSELTSPNPDCVTVVGFDPEYALSGAFLSVADEGTRNYLTKFLKSVKIYSGLSKESDLGADRKQDTLFEIIDAYNTVGMADMIKEIDITSIYSLRLNYDDRLTLDLGEDTDMKVKLTIAKNLIDNGEFENEKGELDLSKAADPAADMKVTFRPIYDPNAPSDENSKPETSTPETSEPDNSSEPETSEPDDSSEPESDVVVGTTTPPEEE